MRMWVHVGPLAHAAVDLRPLTVFLGPSNAGKTYLATLISPAPRPRGRWWPALEEVQSRRARCARWGHSPRCAGRARFAGLHDHPKPFLSIGLWGGALR